MSRSEDQRPSQDTDDAAPADDAAQGGAPGAAPADDAAPADAKTPAHAAPSRHRRSVAAAVVGGIGELLITLGVILGLFVVWQLWWTDVVADREQARIVAELDWAVEPDDLLPRPTPTPTEELIEHRDAAPAIAEPAHATTFATLRVPRWGADYLRPISQGTTKQDVLDTLGIGHYEGTAMPGGIGNFAVAGHRVTYGKPFNRIEELQVGDALVVQTEEVWYVYRVTGALVVQPEQVEVIAPVASQPGATPTEAVMTLTTCHPMYSARERYIVHATLDYWLWTEDGIPPEIQGGE
jgi:sortase A